MLPANRWPRRGFGNQSRSGDAGSVLPLLIGMMACLLFLGAGVTAATSSYVAKQRLQNACDGAAAAATAATSGHGSPTGQIGDVERDLAVQAAAGYLSSRNATIQLTTELADRSLDLTCRSTTDITFGALFASPTVDHEVHAVGHLGVDWTGG